MANETVFIKMVLDSWQVHLKRTDDFFDSLSDDEMMKEVSPGRNRACICWDLTAIHDRMLPLLALGDPLYPQLWEPFVEKPDKEAAELPAVAELRQYWKEVNKNLNDKISSLSPEEWFQKHSAVSAEDFAKEPHRNKLNIIVNRTAHLATHLGQLLLLNSRKRIEESNKNAVRPLQGRCSIIYLFHWFHRWLLTGDHFVVNTDDESSRIYQ